MDPVWRVLPQLQNRVQGPGPGVGCALLNFRLNFWNPSFSASFGSASRASLDSPPSGTDERDRRDRRPSGSQQTFPRIYKDHTNSLSGAASRWSLKAELEGLLLYARPCRQGPIHSARACRLVELSWSRDAALFEHIHVDQRPCLTPSLQ